MTQGLPAPPAGSPPPHPAGCAADVHPQHQLDPSVGHSRLVTHEGKTGRSLTADGLPHALLLTHFQLVLPPVELTLLHSPLPAKLPNRHPALHRTASPIVLCQKLSFQRHPFHCSSRTSAFDSHMCIPCLSSCLYVGKYQAGALAAKDGITGRVRNIHKRQQARAVTGACVGNEK